VIPTGLIFDIPEGYVLLVYSRSGHGFNYDVRLSNAVGIIDSDFRGELKVKLTRDASPGSWFNQFHIGQGDRIAQAMLMPVEQVQIEEVEEVEATVRGNGGMGSTGK
jgi:dUTP pyrophosphatase